MWASEWFHRLVDRCWFIHSWLPAKNNSTLGGSTSRGISVDTWHDSIQSWVMIQLQTWDENNMCQSGSNNFISGILWMSLHAYSVDSTKPISTCLAISLHLWVHTSLYCRSKGTRSNGSTMPWYSCIHIKYCLHQHLLYHIHLISY